MSKPESVIINSRKIDGEISKSWCATLIDETSEIFVFQGLFENEVDHPKLGVIRRDTASYEYYWKHRWFSIFRFHEPEGDLRNYYCNVNLPPKLENGFFDFVDLDLDILVNNDLSYEVLDTDEFAQNSLKYSYSSEIIRGSQRSLEELEDLIAKKDFPFDHADLRTSRGQEPKN